MKKILSIISALAVILSIASCGAVNKPAEETTEETKKSGGKVTQVVVGGDNIEKEGDTSKEAIEFLKKYQPYFYDNFYSKRNQMPLAYISSTKVGEGEAVTTEVYVKDEATMVIIGKDALGRKTRIIYDNNKAYQIYDEEKKLYKKDISEELLKTTIENSMMKTKYSSVSESRYETVSKDFEGKSYTCCIISSYDNYSQEYTDTEYYFDNETNEIRYIVLQGAVSEVKLLSNEIPDESIFDIPVDYAEDTVENLNEEIMNELTKNQEKAE